MKSRSPKLLQPLLAAFALFACIFGGSAAVAQTYTVTISAAQPLALGTVAAAASGTTNFVIASSSASNVSVGSGSGGYVAASGGDRALITVACGNQAACATVTNRVNIQIGSTGTPTGRAGSLAALTVTMGTATLNGSVTGTNPISFQLNAIGRSSSKTFFLGATYPILGDGSSSATAGSSAYYVWNALQPATPSTGPGGAAAATVLKNLSITRDGNELKFGAITKPSVPGSGTISVDAATGIRSVGIGIGAAAPAPTRPKYTVTGENGRSVSISAPNFDLTGPGTIAVTTSKTVGSVVTLTTIPLEFYVGGSFTLSNTTPSGSYSGSFNVLVSYN